ncbi:MAG: Ig-like domain-containing protein, partial [Dehalococcoidia bacterium]
MAADEGRKAEELWQVLAELAAGRTPEEVAAAHPQADPELQSLLTTAWELLREAGAVEPSPQFLGRLEARLRAAMAAGPARQRRRWALPTLRWRWALAPLAAAVAAAVAVSVWVLWPTAPPSPVPTAVPVQVQVLRVEPGPGPTSRMTPVAITFSGPVDHEGVARSLRISPGVQGDVDWEGDTLVFQPRWPGFARGTTYTVQVAAVAATPSPPAQGTVEQSLSFAFATEGALAVESMLPAANAQDVPPDSAIVVQFNRPVATLAELAAATDFLRINPLLTGRGQWVNSTTFVLHPQGGLAPDSRYTVTVARDVSSAVGGSLGADFVWSFATATPAAVQASPAAGAQKVAPDAAVRVTFNMPMDRASAEVAFSLVSAGGQAVAGTFAWPNDRTLVFHPQSLLEPATVYSASVRRGAAAQGRTAATAEEFAWQFTTVGVPRLLDTEPAPGAESVAAADEVTIRFNGAMDRASVEEAVAISPAPDAVAFTWSREGDELRIDFPKRPATTYTVAIGPGAADALGQPLEGVPVELTFTTAALGPSLVIARGDGVAVVTAEQAATVPVRTRNLSLAELSLYSLSLADALSLAGGGAGQEFTPPADSLVRRWSQTIPNPPPNEITTTPIALTRDDGSPLRPGYYLLSASAPPAALEDRALLVATRTHLALKWSPGSGPALVWAGDAVSGEPVAGLPVGIYDSAGTGLTGGTTDAAGVLVAALPPGTQGPISAAACCQGDASLVGSSGPWSLGIGRQDLGLPSADGASPFIGHVYTDRPLYLPGQTVYYKAIVRRDDGGYRLPSSDDTTAIVAADPQGRTVARHQGALSDFGTLAGELLLDEDAAAGNYAFRLLVEGQEVATATFVVAPAEAGPQVGVIPERQDYFAGEE